MCVCVCVCSRPYTLASMSSELGPLQNPRLCFHAVGGSFVYLWQVFLCNVVGGDYAFETVQPYLDQLSVKSGYTLCPGIGQYPPELRFKTKNLREWGIPFTRADSQMCLLWHLPNNEKYPHGDKLRDVCTACRRLSHDIRQLLQKSKIVPECKKESRLHVSSNYPLKYLSPDSRAARVARITKDRKNLSAKLAATPTHFNFNVNDKQHCEILDLVQAIEKKGSKTVEELCSQGDAVLGQDNNLLREAWRQDVKERLDYEKDQAKSGKHI